MRDRTLDRRRNTDRSRAPHRPGRGPHGRRASRVSTSCRTSPGTTSPRSLIHRRASASSTTGLSPCGTCAPAPHSPSFGASIAAPVFVDVNLRDPWWDAALVADTLDGARWCKLNDDELRRLAGPGDLPDAALRLVKRHGLERAFVTLGAAGAFALGADGDCRAVAPQPSIAVIDTVGAGDAFAAAVIAGLLGSWGIEATLLPRPSDSPSGVCGLRGLSPRTRSSTKSSAPAGIPIDRRFGGARPRRGRQNRCQTVLIRGKFPPENLV